MLDSQSYVEVTTSLLEQFGLLRDVEVQYVDQVPSKGSPFHVASTCRDKRTGKQTIYLLNHMRQDEIDGAKDRMTKEISERLTNDYLFFKHTILHEIRHIQHNHDCTPPERREACEWDCDAWAIDSLVEMKDLE